MSVTKAYLHMYHVEAAGLYLVSLTPATLSVDTRGGVKDVRRWRGCRRVQRAASALVSAVSLATHTILNDKYVPSLQERPCSNAWLCSMCAWLVAVGTAAIGGYVYPCGNGLIALSRWSHKASGYSCAPAGCKA